MMIIRKMEEKDIKGVQDVAKASWHSTYEGIIPRDIQDRFLQAAYHDDMMQVRLKESLVLVAEEDENIVGFANFTYPDESGSSTLTAIYLLRDSQGEGLGSALLREGLKALQGVKKIFLDVEVENEAAVHFYKRKGFIIEKTYDDDFDGHILHTHLMSLEIV